MKMIQQFILKTLILGLFHNFLMVRSACADENCDICRMDFWPNNCLVCNIGFAWYDFTCSITCPLTNQYIRTQDYSCQFCDNKCQSCSSFSVCTSCYQGYNLVSGNCVKTTVCAINQYRLSTTAVSCAFCATGCASCSTLTLCTSCLTLTPNLSNGTCTDLPCLANYYLDSSKICQPCLYSCETCSSAINCDSCQTGFYYQSSTKECIACSYDNFYSQANNMCKQCRPYCRNCNDATGCNICIQNFHMHENNCITSCPSNYFSDVTTTAPWVSTGLCALCDSNCLSCSGTKTGCTSCSSPLLLTPSAECQDTCPPDSITNIALLKCITCDDLFYYKDGGCVSCNIKCANCYGPLFTNCLSCPLNKYLHNGQCYTKCPISFYGRKPDFTCQPCDGSCQSCNGATSTNCLTCKSPTFFEINECLTECPLNKYGSVPDNTCQQCSLLCNSCQGPLLNDCLTCSDPYFFDTDTCQLQCEDGQYGRTSDRTCQDCDLSCTTCSGPLSNECLTCPSGIFLYKNTCYATCPSGKLINESNFTCSDYICHESCSTCNGPTNTNCQTCIADYFYDPQTSDSGQCLKTCSSDYYGDGVDMTCKPCNKLCKSCNGPNYDNCTSCFSGQFLDNNICVSQCPERKIIKDQICKTCSQLFTDCPVCTPYECLPCPIKTWNNQLTTTCQPCHKTCKRCLNQLESSCTSCEFPRELFDNKYCQCNEQYYTPIQLPDSCFPCDSSCQTCKGQEITDCLTCPENTYLLNGICYDSCPIVGYFKDASKGICSPCDPSCLSCGGPSSSDCLKCFNSFFLAQGKCQMTCYDYNLNVYLSSNNQKFFSYKPIQQKLNIEYYGCDEGKQQQILYQEFEVKISYIEGTKPLIRNFDSNTILYKQAEQTEVVLKFDAFFFPSDSTHKFKIVSSPVLQPNRFTQIMWDIQISLDKISVKILDGDRILSDKNEINITAIANDLNLPPGTPSIITYAWKCFQITTLEPCTDRFNTTLVFPFNNSIIIPKQTLQVLQTYMVKIQVTINGRIASDQILISVQEFDIPALQVSFQEYFTSSKLNIHEAHTVKLDYGSEIKDPDKLLFSLTFLYEDDTAVKVQEYVEFKFVIWENLFNFLPNKQTMMLKFSIFNPLYSIPSNFRVKVKINMPPTGCQLFIVPNDQKLLALQTLYRLEMQNCSDIDFPITYTFGFYFSENAYLKSVKESTTMLNMQIIAESQALNFFQTYLPQSTIDKKTGVAIPLFMIAIATDSLGGISNSTQKLIVKQKPDIVQDLTMILQRIQSFSENQFTEIGKMSIFVYSLSKYETEEFNTIDLYMIDRLNLALNKTQSVGKSKQQLLKSLGILNSKRNIIKYRSSSIQSIDYLKTDLDILVNSLKSNSSASQEIVVNGDLKISRKQEKNQILLLQSLSSVSSLFLSNDIISLEKNTKTYQSNSPKGSNDTNATKNDTFATNSTNSTNTNIAANETSDTISTNATNTSNFSNTTNSTNSTNATNTTNTNNATNETKSNKPSFIEEKNNELFKSLDTIESMLADYLIPNGDKIKMELEAFNLEVQVLTSKKLKNSFFETKTFELDGQENDSSQNSSLKEFGIHNYRMQTLKTNPYKSDPEFPQSEVSFQVYNLKLSQVIKDNQNTFPTVYPSPTFSFSTTKHLLNTIDNVTNNQLMQNKTLICIQQNDELKSWSSNDCKTLNKDDIYCYCNDIRPVTLVDDIEVLFKNNQIDKAFGSEVLDLLSQWRFWESILFYVMCIVNLIYFCCLFWGYKKDKHQIKVVPENKEEQKQAIDQQSQREILSNQNKEEEELENIQETTPGKPNQNIILQKQTTLRSMTENPTENMCVKEPDDSDDKSNRNLVLFNTRNLKKIIQWEHALFSIFFVYDEKQSRILRFTIQYVQILIYLTTMLTFSALSIAQLVALSIFTTIMVKIAIFLVEKLISSQKLPVKIIGAVITFGLSLTCVWIIIVMIAFSDEDSLNQTTIKFFSQILSDYALMDFLKCCIKLFALSHNYSNNNIHHASKLYQLFSYCYQHQMAIKIFNI